MLTDRQQELYSAFSESTHENEFLDRKTATIVGLAAALALNCSACAEYYLQLAKKAGVSKDEIAEIAHMTPNAFCRYFNASSYSPFRCQ